MLGQSVPARGDDDVERASHLAVLIECVGLGLRGFGQHHGITVLYDHHLALAAQGGQQSDGADCL